MATTAAFFEQPILNSPYEYPSRHWELDASGQPTNRILPERRKVAFITPIIAWQTINAAGGISPLPVIGATPEVARLARALVDAKAVPERAAQDAVHIAIAAVHRVPFLVTWNFRHIANAAARPRIEAVCRDAGIDPPLLCTPEQLVVAEDDDET